MPTTPRPTHKIHQERLFWIQEVKQHWDKYDHVTKVGMLEGIAKLNREYEASSQYELEKLKEKYPTK